MGVPKRRIGKSGKLRGAPAITVDAREKQLINLAVELAEQQLSDGTASAQVITHFLKLGTVQAKLEMEKLHHETEHLKAKTKALQSAEKMEALYAEALKAMSQYQGRKVESEEIVDENL